MAAAARGLNDAASGTIGDRGIAELRKSSGGSLRQDCRQRVEVAWGEGYSDAAAGTRRSRSGRVESGERASQRTGSRSWPPGHSVRAWDSGEDAVSADARARLWAGRI